MPGDFKPVPWIAAVLLAILFQATGASAFATAGPDDGDHDSYASDTHWSRRRRHRPPEGIERCDPEEIRLTGNPPAAVDQDDFYVFTPTLRGEDIHDDDISFSFSIKHRPSWASFDATNGTLSGTPANEDVGLYPGIIISVKVLEDGEDQCKAFLRPFSIEVLNVNDPPVITGMPVPEVAQDSLYSFSPVAGDPDLPYGDVLTFYIVNQPPWSSFDPSTGTLTGIPGNADVGDYQGIVILVEDLDGLSAELEAFSITVINVNDPPALEGTPPPAIVAGDAYQFSPLLSDPDLSWGDAYLFEAENVPDWLHFDRHTGEISGMSTYLDVGVFENILITVSDADGVTAALPAFSIEVIQKVEGTLLAVAGAAGELTVDDPSSPAFGTQIVIPEGALAADTEITISLAKYSIESPTGEWMAVSSPIEFEPSGTVFQQPATIALPFEGGSPEDLHVLVLEEGAVFPEEVAIVAVDTLNRFVYATANSFSTFQVFYTNPRALDIEIASISSLAQVGNSHSTYSKISGDGRHVTFQSFASNLVPDDTNGRYDAFVRDRQTDTTTRASVTPSGGQAAVLGVNWNAYPSISGNGRHVAFQAAARLTSDDLNLASDIYVRDRDVDGNGVFDTTIPGSTDTRLVSVCTDSSGCGDPFGTRHSGLYPNISSNGRFVVFVSSSANLVAGDTNLRNDIFIHDRDCDAAANDETSPCMASGNGIFDEGPEGSGHTRTVRINLCTDDCPNTWPFYRQASWHSDSPSISANGRYVVYESAASNLVADDTNNRWDIFLHDRGPEGSFDQDGYRHTTLISRISGGALGNGQSYNPMISADGRFVAFESQSSNLAGYDLNGAYDIFLCDRDPDADGILAQGCESLELVSRSTSGNSGRFESRNPSISGDGRFVAFESSANDLVDDDPNQAVRDVFVYDRRSSQIFLASAQFVLNTQSEMSVVKANGSSLRPSLSFDGQALSFESSSRNLVQSPTGVIDSNLAWDVLVAPNNAKETRMVVKDPLPSDVQVETLWPPITIELVNNLGQRVVGASACITLTLNPRYPGTPVVVEQRCPLNGVVCFEGIHYDYVLAFPPSGNRGTQTLDVTFSTEEFSPVQTSVVISSNLPIKIVLASAPPVAQVAGKAWSTPIVAKILDAYGNVVGTDNTTQVRIRTVGTAGTFSGASQTVAVAVNGIVTFDQLQYDEAGPLEVAVQDVAGVLDASDGGSATIVIGPDVPARMRFRVPVESTQQAGSFWSGAPVIEILDAYDNVVDSDNSTVVTLSNATASAPFPAAARLSEQAVGGIVVFDEIQYQRAEIFSFDFLDTAGVLDASAVSGNTVEITPAVPAQAVFMTPPPGLATAHQRWSPFAIEVQDRFGNRATQDSSTMLEAHVLSGASGFSPDSQILITVQNGVGLFDQLAYDVNESILVGFVDSFYALDANGVIGHSVYVAAPEVKQLALQTPAQFTAQAGGRWPTISVELQDEAGFVVPTATGQLSLTLSGASGSLQGDTLTDTAYGAGAFSGLSYSVSGISLPEQVTAEISFVGHPGVPPATVAVQIAPGLPDHLAVTGLPGGPVPAEEAWPSFSVRIEDRFGNLAGSATNLVDLKLLSFPAGGPAALQGTVSRYAAGGIATFDGISYPAGGTLKVTAVSEGLSFAPATTVTITGDSGPPPPQSAGGVSFDPPVQISLGQVPFSSASGFSALPQAVIRVENNNQVPLTVAAKDFLSNLGGSAPALRVRTLAAPSGFGLDGVIEPGEFAALAVEVDSSAIASGSQTLSLMVNAQDPSGQTHASAYSISADFVDVGSAPAVIYPYAGPVQLGSVSFNQIRSQLAQLVNLSSSNLPVDVTGLSAVSGDLDSFAMNLPPGAGTTLPPGGKVDFTVSLVGRIEGTHAASVAFSIDDGSGPSPVSQTFEGEMTGNPTAPKISRASFICGASGESYLEISGTGFGHLPIERGFTSLIVDGGTPVILQGVLDTFSDARATDSLILVPASELGDLVPGTEQTLQVRREVDGTGLLSDAHVMSVPVESIFCGAGAAMLSSARFVCDSSQNLRLEVAGANFIPGTHALDLSGMVIPITALESPKASASLLSLPYTGASGPLDITVTNLLAPGINETSTLHVTAPDANTFCGQTAPTPRITRAYYECQADIPSLVLEGENFTSGGAGWRQELLESALVIDAGDVPNPFAGSRISVTTPFDAVRVTAGPNSTLERPAFFNPFFFGHVSKTRLRMPFSASIPGEGIRIALATPQGISNYIEGLSPDLSGRPCSVLARGNEITNALPGGTNPVPVDGSLQSLVAADMDGDGDKDIVAAGAGMPGSLSLIRNNVNSLGTLDVETLAVQVGAIPDRNVASNLPQNPLLVLADFDGAFGTDIAVTGEGSPGLVSVLFNSGAGTFGSVQTYFLTGEHPVGIAAAHLRDSGPLDLVVASEAGIEIFLGDGFGGFATTPVVEPLSGGAYALAAGDFDLSDLAEEIVVAHGSDASPLLSVLQTDGFTGLVESRVEMDLADVIAEPFLVAASFAALVQGRPRSIEAVDVDGDGDLDLSLPGLLLVNFSQNRFLADGTMPFEGPRDLRQAFFFTQTSAPVDVVRTGDFDGDGLADIVGLARGNPAVLPVALGCPRESEYFLIPPLASCLRLSGDSGLGPDGAFNFFGQISNLPFVPSTLAVADLNGDGRDDVITGNTDGTLAYIPARSPQPVATSAFNQPFVPQDPAGLVFSTASRAHELAGYAWKPFSVSLIDEFGVLAQTSGVSVTVTATSGPGVLSGTLTKQTVDGVATFDDLSYDTAGAVTLAVTSPGLSGTLTAQMLVEDEAPAFRLVFEPSALDFGTVPAGDTKVLSVIARNFGPAASLADASVSSLAGTPFALLGATQEVPDSYLSTGEDITLYFRFTPVDAQPVSEEFSVYLNSDPGNVFTLTLTGNQAVVSEPPLVSVIPGLFAGEDQSFSYALGSHASDPDNDTLYFGIENLPLWASFNSLTGEISGLPLNVDVGEYPGVALRVTDLHSFEVHSAQFAITVENANDAPILLPLENAQAAFQDEFFVLEIEADDDDLVHGTETLTFSLNGQDLTGDPAPSAALPWALMVQTGPTRAILYGTPANADVADLIPLELTVRDTLGESATQVLTLTVHDKNDAPVFGAIPAIITVPEDAAAWQFALPWSDADRLHDPGHGVIFSDNGTLPGWAAVEPLTGILVGSTSNQDVGLYEHIVITVTDEYGASASTPAFSLRVENINDNPVISGAPPLDAYSGEEYKFVPGATDEDVLHGDQITFTATGIPSWAQFDSASGTLIGTPSDSDVGSSGPIVITANDLHGGSGSLAPFEILVRIDRAPVISGSPQISVLEGETYSFQAAAVDPEGEPVGFEIDGNPAWTSFSSSSGLLSGIAPIGGAGQYGPISIRALDPAGHSASLTAFSISVFQKAPSDLVLDTDISTVIGPDPVAVPSDPSVEPQIPVNPVR